MNDLIPTEAITERNYQIRCMKVMLDADPADLYVLTTKRLNEQVRRNCKRFPADFLV